MATAVGASGIVWRQLLADDRVSLLVIEAEFGRPLFLTTACGD
jgi:hypothetical protein